MKDDDKTKLPLDVEPRRIKAVAVSHAHVDHTGGLPYLYISAKPPCYMTKATRTIVKVLLDDMLNISADRLPFEKEEMDNFLRAIQVVKAYNEPHLVPGMDCSLTFLDAGHIPGSAMVLVSIDGKTVLYTGDINTRDTRLLWGAKTSGIPPIDALIIESTYATRTHPNRLDTEREFVSSIKQVLDAGGKVLIPAFGVARSQEILSVLQTYGFMDRNVVVDGMAREISALLLRNPDFLRSGYSLDKITMIKRERSQSDRRKALSSADIIIAPSGMMKGGTVRFYAPPMLVNRKNGVFLVSYQVEGTPGRILLDERKYELDEEREMAAINANETAGPSNQVDVQARVAQFDFSSHSDGNDLLQFVKALQFKNGKKDVFCIHGDLENCEFLARSINEQVPGASATAPKRGDTVTI